MTLATPWYESQGLGTLLTLVAGLITGFFGGWATLRAANPKRLLAYWMPRTMPILNASDSVGDLLVMRGGQALRNPHVLDVRLTNCGRRDVASSHFDGDLPILLDVGAPVVEILGITSQPTSLHVPTVVVDDTALKIAPGLIATGQTISFSLLVDGPAPTLSCRASLVDVTVQEKREPTRQQSRSDQLALVKGIKITVLALAVITFLQVLTDLATPALSVVGPGAIALFLIAAITIWELARVWARRRRARRSTRRD